MMTLADHNASPVLKRLYKIYCPLIAVFNECEDQPVFFPPSFGNYLDKMSYEITAKRGNRSLGFVWDQVGH